MDRYRVFLPNLQPPVHSILNYSELPNDLWYTLLWYIKNFSDLAGSFAPPPPQKVLLAVSIIRTMNLPLLVDTSSFVRSYQDKTNGALNIENGKRTVLGS